MKKNYLIAALIAGMSINVVATESTPVPNVFTAGDEIVAADMNENFAALAARISALESQINTPAKTYAQLLSDHTYSGQFVFFGYVGDDDGDNGFGSSSDGTNNNENPYVMGFMKGGGQFSMTLNADGSVSNDTGSEQEIESKLTAVCESFIESGCTGYSSDSQLYTDQWNNAEAATTWSVNEDTGIVTITWDGDVNDTDQFQASEDGSVLYSLSFTNEVDGNRQIENSVAILARKK